MKIGKTLLILVFVATPVLTLAQADGSAVMSDVDGSGSSTPRTVLQTQSVGTSATPTTVQPAVAIPRATTSASSPGKPPAPALAVPVNTNPVPAHSVIEPIQEHIQNTSIPSGNSNTISLTIIGGILALVLAVMAFALNLNKNIDKSDKNNKKDDQSRCFDIKKLMEEKLNELTDLQGQIKDRAKEKLKDTIKEAISGTPEGEFLAMIEKKKEEYEKLKSLYEQCIIDTGQTNKIILVDSVYTFVSDQGMIFQGMFDLLEKYPNKKILLTGANDEQYKKWNLDKMPYEVFTLKHNPEKTNPDYFKRLLEHLKLSKNDVIYFEHNPLAVKSAESIGIVSYHYAENKKDLGDLKKFLDKHL